jgi:magnesium-transporting ATPase (P-type)
MNLSHCVHFDHFCCQIIGTYAPEVFTTPLEPYSTLCTLIFVLLVTSAKEGYEDVKRYRLEIYMSSGILLLTNIERSDELENTRPVTICSFDSSGKLVETERSTEDIKSGDIIKLNGHCQVPVDLVLIMSSYYSDGNKCYVETANIDGETNLKMREAPSALLSKVSSGVVSEDLFQGHIEFEPPNKNIHNFIGALHIKGLEPIALSADNMLLRASVFSNTEWGYGIAVYTGQESKIQMNNRSAPTKISRLEEYVNEAIILIFITQVIMLFVLSS